MRTLPSRLRLIILKLIFVGIFIELLRIIPASKASDPRASDTSVRLWLDSTFFSAGEVQILKDIVANSSGRLVISGETHASFMSTKGAYVPQSWDIYWTVRRACHSVLGAIAPPKRVNCVPGVEAFAYKQPLVRTMQEAYGEAAFDYIPRSYMLPSQYWIWRSWTQRSGSPADLPWVLKANNHRGRGVRVMRQKQAQRQALRGGGAQVAGDMATQKGYVLVQSYVRRQFLHENRPSYLRLWVVVTSVRPLRAYLFRGGVLVFGDQLGAGGRAGGGRGAGNTGSNRQGSSRQHGSTNSNGPQSHRRLRSHTWKAVYGQPSLIQLTMRRSGAPNRHSLRRRLQQQPQRQEEKGSGQQQYEMHQVNYWTISGEKMHPWTVGQLRRHAEATYPDDPQVFERAWAHARASVGMVLASATRRMRTAARGLAALDGCGFEVFGVDFLLNATFHPTLVEVNALPSLARLRVGPEDPAPAAASTASDAAGGDRTGTSQSRDLPAGVVHSTGGTYAAGQMASFDMEKERFLNHALRLIGTPLGPPPVSGSDFIAASRPTAGDASRDSVASPSVGGVLRAMAALLRPPNNETSELQTFLRVHLPLDVAAAEAVLSKLRPLLCPVPASWGPAPGWPVMEITVPEAAAEAAEGSASVSGGGRRLTAGVDEASGEAADSFLESTTARRPRPRSGWDMAPHVASLKVTKHGTGSGGRGRVAKVVSAATSATAAAATIATSKDVTLGQSDGARASPSEQGASDTVGLRNLQGDTMADVNGARGDRVITVGTDGGAGGKSVMAGNVAGEQAPVRCRQHCYDWDVLAAIADTEYELQQNLDFDPIFPLAAAHDLNSAALEASRKVETAVRQKAPYRGRPRRGMHGEGGGVGNNARGGGSGSVGSGSGTFTGSALLDPQTGLQRLQTGLGFVRESIAAVDMDLMRSMRYMTTTPYILARTTLPYSRIDAALTAYEAVRQRNGTCAAGDSAACAVWVLQDTLAELCSGRLKPEQD